MSRSPLVPLVFGLALLLVLPGCLQSEQTTRVAKDGSGKVSMRVVVETAKIKQLEEMMAGMGAQAGQGGGNPMEDMEPGQLRKIAAESEHIKILKVETTENAAKTEATHIAEFEFDSLENLYASGLVMNVNAKLQKLENGNYRFSMGIDAGQEGMDEMLESPEAREQIDMMMAMFEPIVGTFSMKNTMALPTEVVDTNGDRSVAGQVTWTLGFKDMLKAEKRMQWVEFKGDGLDWKPFTMDAKAMEAARKKALRAAAEKEEEAAAPTTPEPAPMR